MRAIPLRATGAPVLARIPLLFKRRRRAPGVIALVAGAILSLAGPAVASAADCNSETGCTETARSANDFYESVGVNTHLGYTDTVYWKNWPMVRDRLKELGVSHLRDGTFPAHWSTGPTVAARYREAGIGLNLLTGLEQAPSGPGGSGEGLDTRLGWIKSENLTRQLVGIEGSNESWNDATAIRNLQCATFDKVSADAALASTPVIGPSGGYPFSMTTWYDRVGDLSACLDRGNLHPYPGADAPHLHQDRDLSVAMEWGQRTYGDKPYWATETGYWNTLADPNGVSEWAAGVYVPRAALEYFRRGIERTQLYELIDLKTSSAEVIDRYGLLRTDGTRKPAFIGLSNLMAITRDAGDATGALDYSITCTSGCRTDDPIRHVLTRHSDGSYFIAFWAESEVWDPGAKVDAPEAAQGMQITLGEIPAQVEFYNPAKGTSPFRTDTSGSQVIATNATDHVRVVRVTLAPEPEPESAPSLLTTEAEDMEETPWFPSVYPDPGIVQDDSTASALKRMKMQHYGELSKTITTARDYNAVVIAAKGDQCAGAPQLTLKIDGAVIAQRSITTPLSDPWAYELISTPVQAGTHTITLSYDNDHEDGACNRSLYLDRVTLQAA